MVSNPNFYGQSTTGTPNQIEDGIDFPHTGIIKALSDGLGQNYGISGFDITIDNATQIDVDAGVIFRDGKREAIDAVTNLALISTYTNGYHLVVVNSSNAIVVRNPPAADKVAAFSTGDTIIAMVTHTGNSPMPIQYLTVNKNSNSLSIGHDDSGYTEAMSITSNAGDVTIENKVQDKDIIIKGNDGGVSTTVATFDMSSKTLIVPTKINTETIQLGYGSGSAKLQVYNTGENMQIYAAGDSGGNVKILELDAGTDGAEANRIATVTGNLHVSTKVGIGLNNPTGVLHVKGTSASDIDFLVEVAEDGASASPDIVYFRNSASPAAGDDLAHIRFRGKDSAGNATDYVDIFAEIVDATDGQEDGRITFRTLKNNVVISRIKLNSNEAVINEDGVDIDFRVEGNNDANLLVCDAGLDRVKIGTSVAGDGVLTLGGAINTKGRIQNIINIAGNALGPPPVPLYNILKTDDVIIASAPAGSPPNALTLHLPDAEAEDVGRTYRIVAQDITSGLTLDRTGTDDTVVDTTNASLSLPYSLAAGKIYDVVCIDADKWMLMQLN